MSTAKPSHKAAARMVGYCLTAGDEAAMWSLSAILHKHLQPGDRALLAVAALYALTDHEYREVVGWMEGCA